jgi:hypothetical protein
MRRTIATSLIAVFLFSAAPSVRRDDDEWGPLRIIRKIERVLQHFLSKSPNDGGDTLTPPKP